MQRPTALALLAVAAALLGARCPAPEPRPPRPEPRAYSTEPGSCDGIIDYGSEFEIRQIRLAGMRPVGLGVWEVELDLEIGNLGGARFLAASLTPDFSAAPDLAVVASPAPLAAEFGPIDPYGSAWSTATLLFQIPALRYADLLSRLRDGSIPLIVHAAEANELAPGVEIHEWTGTEDALYAIASEPAGGFGQPPNVDPGDGPFAPGQEFVLLFLTPYSDDMSTVFEEFAPGELFYLVEDPSHPLGGENDVIPDAFDRVRVVDADRLDQEDDQFTAWVVTVKRTDAESLPEIYQNASFCTGPEFQVDLPVQASRLTSLDGAPVDPEVSDAKPQGIRFNELPFGGGAVTLSGQVQGHVLKPRLSLRIRDGHVSTVADFDTDLALSAELRAKTGNEVAIESLELWSLCFPLPEFSVGPVSVSTNLQLSHTLGAEASLAAGAVVGFEKHFDSGFTIACESGAGCSSEGRRSETPIQFTPPRLTDDTAAHARVETTIAASLNFFSPYPVCDAGPGVFLETTAWGTLDVTPTEEPWWSMHYGLDVTAGIELDVLGIDIARYDTDVFSRVDAGPAAEIGSPRSSGEDQRWSVAIDDTAVPNGVNLTSIAALPDGASVVVAGEPVGGRARLVKLDRFGAFEWAQHYSLAKRARKVEALSDGSVVVVGEPAWLARHDANGSRIWSFDATVARDGAVSAPCSLRDVVPIETAPGVYDYVAVGIMGATPLTSNDGCALRVEADGDVAWAKVYEQEDVQYFHGATLLRDGAIAVAGEAYVNLFGNRRMPLVAKLDAATGDVVWSRGLPTLRFGRANAVAEDDDGTLYVAGAAGRTVTQTGAALLAAIDADGGSARHGLLLQDFYWEYHLDFEDFVATTGGDTAYDELFDIEPQGDGFVVVGRSGLGTATGAWAAKVNRKLGPEWFRTWDGGSTDALTGVDVADDGIFVSGYSASLPEPDGPNTGENQLWVMKLPFEGAVEMRPNAGVTTRYVQPGVRFSSADPAITLDDDGVSELSLAAVNALVTNNATDPNFSRAAANQCVERLTRSGRPSALDACIEDADDDLVADADDNCAQVANADQGDADADGFGNVCDADLDQSGAIDDADRILFAASFGLAGGDEGFVPAADFDGDGLVDLADFARLRAMQGGAPGDAVSLPAADPLETPLVELIFPATGTHSIEVESGTLVTVQLRVTPGASGIAAYGFALDFGAGLDFDGATELVPGGFAFALDPQWSVVESETGSDGSAVACDAATLGAGASGAPFVACEYAFVASSSAGIAARIRPDVDGVIAGSGADLSARVAFVPAAVEVVPEAQALVSGLAAASAIAALARRKRAPRAGGAPTRGLASSR